MAYECAQGDSVMPMTETKELKTVLITGATDGLGRAAALLLAREGYRVFAGGRNAERRAALDAEAREKKLPLEAVEMDVCDDASVDRAIEGIRRKAGPIDVLVNNAGIAIVAVMEEISLADLRRQFETNVFGAVRVTQRVLPEMRNRQRGRIVNMSSVSGKFASPLFGPYAGSKFALEAVSDALRLEVHQFGIYVVLIEPGYIPTNMGNASLELSQAYAGQADRSPYAAVYHGFRRSWKKATTAPKLTPEDCARVILRALRETPPKARYTVMQRAWLVGFARRFLSDRALDRMTLRQYGLDPARKNAAQSPAATASGAPASRTEP
jgi:NAD(P)-dependent dehydrogenase (short-subunit alcohol dehydrogenase family)